MTGSNSLGSHSGESSNSRADKMSGTISEWKRNLKKRGSDISHLSGKFMKKFYSKKRRQFLNNENNFEKL